MRRYGEPPLRDRKYRARPGAYALLPRNGQILLTHQSAPVPEFQLPGGGIDPGETAIAALHREVFEETGWSISNPRRLGVYKRFVFMPEYDLWAEKICHIYVARPVRARALPPEPDHDAVWTNIWSSLGLIRNAGDHAFMSAYFAEFAGL